MATGNMEIYFILETKTAGDDAYEAANVLARALPAKEKS
jgi:hypothetical protein